MKRVCFIDYYFYNSFINDIDIYTLSCAKNIKKVCNNS